MMKVVFPGFYAALIRADSFISVVERNGLRNEKYGSENVFHHVAMCEPGDWAACEWHMHGLPPQGAYSPLATTKPPAFTGYAEVHQTVDYAASAVSKLVSKMRGAGVVQNDVHQEPS
jgi:hypothetical protein